MFKLPIDTPINLSNTLKLSKVKVKAGLKPFLPHSVQVVYSERLLQKLRLFVIVFFLSNLLIYKFRIDLKFSLQNGSFHRFRRGIEAKFDNKRR